jgi:hypothetical protein
MMELHIFGFGGRFSPASAKSSSVLSQVAPGSFSTVITLDSVPSSLTAVNDSPQKPATAASSVAELTASESGTPTRAS